jgi:hypothetical protein
MQNQIYDATDLRYKKKWTIIFLEEKLNDLRRFLLDYNYRMKSSEGILISNLSLIKCSSSAEMINV